MTHDPLVPPQVQWGCRRSAAAAEVPSCNAYQPLSQKMVESFGSSGIVFSAQRRKHSEKNDHVWAKMAIFRWFKKRGVWGQNEILVLKKV